MSWALALDRFPLWIQYAGTVALVLASIVLGYRVAASRKDRHDGHPEGPIGSVVGAILGLLAFILAFTFGIASSRFDARKQLLLDDVNAIERAARRTDLLPEPQRSHGRALLKRYVHLRVEITRDLGRIPAALAETQAIHDSLWSDAVSLARADMNSDIGALYVESLNELMEVTTSRATVSLQYRIPSAIWSGLMLLTVISMAAVGYQFGNAGRAGFLVHLGLALAFGAVIVLIGQLDRTAGGLIRIDQRPMIELERRLGG
jgi:hypothetical protein